MTKEQRIKLKIKLFILHMKLFAQSETPFKIENLTKISNVLLNIGATS